LEQVHVIASGDNQAMATKTQQSLSKDALAMAADTQKPRQLKYVWDFQDRIFRGVMRSAGSSVRVIMGLVGLFLTLRASEALGSVGFSFFTTTINPIEF
jgi:phosphate transport system permease protein